MMAVTIGTSRLPLKDLPASRHKLATISDHHARSSRAWGEGILVSDHLKTTAPVLARAENFVSTVSFMDLFAGLFGSTLITISLVVAYHWGIKPEREEKKRRAERELAEIRRQHFERARRRSAV